MNFLSNPVWLLGGLPGAEERLRFRIDRFAVVRTKAPNLDKTFRVAFETREITFRESNFKPLNFIIAAPDMLKLSRR